ncbi:MAG: HAD family phosphatase [Alphaproteobacteria bacterium]|nr:HAD family phosphatase [Alphaproteobacteria bacterium SS10]
MPIKAILWDCDGTLVDSEPLHKQCIRAVANQFGANITGEDVDRFLGRTTQAIWDYLHSEQGLTLTYDEWCEEVHRYYEAHVHEVVKPRPGVESQILLFAAMGLRQAIVSNSTRRMVDASSLVIGPRNLLEFSISVDDVSKPKPDPEPYFRAALRMMLPPNQCLVMEDSPTGARAGKAAGMQVMAWPQVDDLIYDEVDYITDDLTTPDWVRILRRRRKPKPLIARSLAAGIPNTPPEDGDDGPDPKEGEEHPTAAPKEE